MANDAPQLMLPAEMFRMDAPNGAKPKGPALELARAMNDVQVMAIVASNLVATGRFADMKDSEVPRAAAEMASNIMLECVKANMDHLVPMIHNEMAWREQKKPR